MKNRLPVIFIGIPAVFALIWAGDLARLTLITLICLLAQRELFGMLLPDMTKRPLIEGVAAIAILTSTLIAGEHGIMFGFILAETALMLFAVLRGLQKDNMRRFMVGTLSLFYLPFTLSFFLLLAHLKGPVVLFAILLSVWALDMGAYAVGMPIRGPKLAPQISPNKTISGAIGGSIISIACTWALGTYGYIHLQPGKLLLFAICIAVIGQIADLFESVMKRESATKDSGTILGAHGGILDRIDSILFLGPVSYFFIVIFA